MIRGLQEIDWLAEWTALPVALWIWKYSNNCILGNDLNVCISVIT